MYTQMAFVTSVRGITFFPQIAANASLSFFGAKMPLPAFFIANAFFLPFAFLAIMPIVFFSALVLRSSALVIVAFVVLVVATVVADLTRAGSTRASWQPWSSQPWS